MGKFSNKRMLESDELPTAPSLKEAFWYWLKLGFISFGGPAGQISIMHHDLVEQKRWISEKRFLHALNYCMLLPGPEAQQLATYIGWLMHRTKGGLIAGCLFVLPSFFVLVLLSYIYLRFGHLPVISGVLYFMKPAIVAVVIFAAYRIGLRTLKNQWLWLIAITSFVSIAFFNLPFPLIIAVAAMVGFIGSHYRTDMFLAKAGHQFSNKQYGRAVIDDDTPTPRHARFSMAILAKVLLIGFALWLFGMAVLIVLFGWQGAFTQMAWFFTKAALLTFGGAYAVLPYVYQGAVEHYHWLTATQMMDGLALGEATPGPLIMVVTYVGFVGGWTQQVFGVESLLLSGVIAASVVTFFTFLPSFVFIFMGGPFVESTQGSVKLTAPLTAITAAVVGVIASLALFFARHLMLLSQDSTLGLPIIDWVATTLTMFGFIALWKFNFNIIKLILIYILLGIFVTLLA